MNYDGPNYFKRKEKKSTSPNKKNQNKKAPLEHLIKEQNQRNQLSGEKVSNHKEKDMGSEKYYFKSKYIPKSLQHLDGWKKEKWDKDLFIEIEERLMKESEDYLLFSENLSEEAVSEKLEDTESSLDDGINDTMKIKQKVAEIENTLETAALVRRKIKPDLKKPNTGLHRTLSKIMAEDAERFKN